MLYNIHIIWNCILGLDRQTEFAFQNLQNILQFIT